MILTLHKAMRGIVKVDGEDLFLWDEGVRRRNKKLKQAKHDKKLGKEVAKKCINVFSLPCMHTDIWNYLGKGNSIYLFHN